MTSAPSGNFLQLVSERWRLGAVRMTQTFVARGEGEDALAGSVIFGAGFFHDGAKNFTVAFKCDRQAMLEIPGRKTSLLGIITQVDLAIFKRLAIRRSDDRQQNAASRTIGQHVPIDIE